MFPAGQSGEPPVDGVQGGENGGEVGVLSLVAGPQEGLGLAAVFQDQTHQHGLLSARAVERISSREKEQPLDKT